MCQVFIYLFFNQIVSFFRVIVEHSRGGGGSSYRGGGSHRGDDRERGGRKG